MKKEFTFCVVTYNQQKYIIDALESIKYQILTYGGGIESYLVIADDASNDMTLHNVDLWLNQNSSLFTESKILRSTENQGTVANVMSALKAVQTEAFKLLAGDDVFSAENCFELIELLNKCDLVSYFDAEFVGHEIENNTKSLPNFLFYIDSSSRFLQKHLIYEYVLSGTGTAFKHSLLTPDFYDFMKKFVYLDDHAIWTYLFNNMKVKTAWRNSAIILHRVEMNSLQHNPELIAAVQRDRRCLNDYHRAIVSSAFSRIMLDLNDKALDEKSLSAEKTFNLLRRTEKAPRMLWRRLTKMKSLMSVYMASIAENKVYLPKVLQSAELFLTNVSANNGENK